MERSISSVLHQSHKPGNGLWFIPGSGARCGERKAKRGPRVSRGIDAV